MLLVCGCLEGKEDGPGSERETSAGEDNGRMEEFVTGSGAAAGFVESMAESTVEAMLMSLDERRRSRGLVPDEEDTEPRCVLRELAGGASAPP